MLSRDLVQDPATVEAVLASSGPFVAVVHCVGMLLPNSLNKFASGSGSSPGAGADLGSAAEASVATTAPIRECVAEALKFYNMCTSSEPSKQQALRAGTSHKAIIATTATVAADAAARHAPGCPFVFISVAEAGWPQDAPLLPPFLREYLHGKRNVEAHLKALAADGALAWLSGSGMCAALLGGVRCSTAAAKR
jgi:hypothetical protein